MSLLDLLQTLHRYRSTQGRRFNTVVCRPTPVERWMNGNLEQLRLVFSEHGIRLQVDAGSPWPDMSFLWIDRPLETAAA